MKIVDMTLRFSDGKIQFLHLFDANHPFEYVYVYLCTFYLYIYKFNMLSYHIYYYR